VEDKYLNFVEVNHFVADIMYVIYNRDLAGQVKSKQQGGRCELQENQAKKIIKHAY